MATVSIYFAGSIQKGHGHEVTYNSSMWTQDDISKIRELLLPIKLHVLDPSNRSDDMNDAESVFGRDMTQIFLSDFVFVDARERRGIGVGAEMMWAKINNIPVLSWAPPDSHYNKKNTTVLGAHVDHFIHPFILCLSDYITSSIDDGVDWIKKILFVKVNSFKVKDISSIREYMEHYKNTQLQNDVPLMKELMNDFEKTKI